MLASFVHDTKGIPVETVRSVLAGFKTKTVVFLADEKCEVDQSESTARQHFFVEHRLPNYPQTNVFDITSDGQCIRPTILTMISLVSFVWPPPNDHSKNGCDRVWIRDRADTTTVCMWLATYTHTCA